MARPTRFDTMPSHLHRREAADDLAGLSDVDSTDPVVRRAVRMAVTLGSVNAVVDELGYVGDEATAERVARIRAHLDALRDVP